MATEADLPDIFSDLGQIDQLKGLGFVRHRDVDAEPGTFPTSVEPGRFDVMRHHRLATVAAIGALVMGGAGFVAAAR